MNKRFLKSVAILGLTSTALGMAQPVGAIVSGKYHHTKNPVVKEIKEKLDKLSNSGRKLPSQYGKEAVLRDLFNLAFYLIGKEEFHETEYQLDVEKLRTLVFGYDEYLKSLPFKTSDVKYKSSEQFEQLTIPQYNEIETGLKNALSKFAQDIINTQSVNSDLVTIPLYVGQNSNSFYKDGYYDIFYGIYIANSGISDVINEQLVAEYRNILKEIFKTQKEIENLFFEKDFKNKDELQFELEAITKQNKKKSSITYEFEKSTDTVKETIFAEDIPNLRTAKQTLKDLKGLLSDCLSLEKEVKRKNLVFKETKEREDQKTEKTLIIDEPAKNEVLSTVTTETTQTHQKPLRQTETVETFTINFPTQLTDSKTLSSLEGYGSTAVLGTIGGSKTTPLVGSEGGYLNIELRTHASEAPVTSESAQNAQLSDGSGEPDVAKVNYKIEQPQEILQASEELKVIEEPSVQKSQEILDTSQVSEETKNKDSLDEYTKSQINFWIADFGSTLNKLTLEQLYSEDLAGLISRGQESRKKLDNALGEDKYNGNLKRDLDQLETISNAISRIMENNTVTVAQ
ncbi:UNVERIFIED_CONTAM: hypothetical protein KB579_03875 [Streptococcus canis]|uniref:hypothetical protein n=1 Tax=Streptococcus canis TaxID=1329 RepID=UPI0024DEF5E6|nr:hypothetical protein [Streptococcus canis]